LRNNYFQFKQFTIQQEKSSMKICTDSCLFGAWVAEKMERKFIEPQSILDIGTGTGLLSLMAAQKCEAKIDAIEIDKDSYLQAKGNFSASKWSPRLEILHADATMQVDDKKYDLIICNPPFYENDLTSSDRRKNIAKHHEALTLEDLIAIIQNKLSENGGFAVLLPFHRVEYFKQLATRNNFFVADEVQVKQTPQHPCFRGFLSFTTKKVPHIIQELIIKDKEGKYTAEFNYFLQDYYL
jgi:tRNA1Val (adenine37-N6)-methyltransferase